MIAIRIPAHSVEDAVQIRDRIRGLILAEDDTCHIARSGVEILTTDPVRVVQALAEDGFF
jgi:hypothetical protein